MSVRSITTAFVSTAMIAVIFAWVFVPQGLAAGPEPTTDDERPIALDQAPAVVRSAAVRLAGETDKISKVTREEEDEEPAIYEVEYTDGAFRCSATLSTEGELMEEERTVEATSLPAAVRAALGNRYPEATIADPQRVTRTWYEVQVVSGGRRHEVNVDPSGLIHDKSKSRDRRCERNGDEQDEHDDRD